MEALNKDGDWLQGLPLRPRDVVMKIGYETNVFGDSPRSMSRWVLFRFRRKVSVDFVQNKERRRFSAIPSDARPRMENLKPRWVGALQSVHS